MIELQKIKEWYANKTNKTVDCFDEYDLYICKVIYEFNKENK